MPAEQDVENPAKLLWLRQYPFRYWDNRIKKVNRYNPEDKLEALVLLFRLTDLYTHLFVAQAQNPDQPWFIVKEKAMPWDISDTLDKFSEQTEHGEKIFVENLQSDIEEVISYSETEPEWDVSKKDWIALDFLGCPAEFDEQEKQVEFLESPDLHYAGANAILNFWRENKPILNDIKHGFRLLPFRAESIDFLLQNDYLEKSEDVNELKGEILEFEEREEWALSFLRMDAQEAGESDPYDYEVSLHLHKIHIDLAVSLSKLALNQLHNLFGRWGVRPIAEEIGYLISRSTSDDGEAVVNVIEHLGNFPVVYKPGTSSTS